MIANDTETKYVGTSGGGGLNPKFSNMVPKPSVFGFKRHPPKGSRFKRNPPSGS